jgi:Ran GTPase-activating protein (RanGAP) involved in mRNA processing and transport
MPITELELEQLISLDRKELRCSRKNLTHEDLKLICSFLENHKTIKSLYVFWNKIDDEGAKILAKNKTLTSLYIGSNQIGDEGVKALAQNPTLTLLELTGNPFGNKGAEALAQSETLLSVDVTGSKIDKKGVEALAGSKSLTAFSIRGDLVDEKTAKMLAANPRLTSLDLTGNPIGIEGLKALAQNKKLTSLNLSGTKIGDEGAEILAQNLTLNALDLMGIGLSDKGVKALAQNPTLTSLKLAGNKISPEGAKFLAENKTLRKLHLPFNKIGDKGAEALAKNETLTELEVRNNQISEVGAKALAQNPILKTLDIAENLIGEKGGKALAENKTLTSLDVCMTSIGEEAGNALANNPTLKTLYVHKEDVGTHVINTLLNSKTLASLYVSGNKYFELSNAQDYFRTNEGQDSRLFNTWYANLDVQRIVWFIYQEELAKKATLLAQDTLDPSQNPYLDPFVFFDGLESFSFNEVMTLSKKLLLDSNKSYFPIIFKPELGSAHYMSGILRKELDGSFTFFLFNPLGYPDEEAKKRAQSRLELPSTTEVGGMKLIMCPYEIQSLSKDEGSLVSCGPLCIQFIEYALQHPEWITNLNEQFDLPEELMHYTKDSPPQYKAGVETLRAAHDELLGKIPNDALDEIDNFYAPMTQYFIDGLSKTIPIDDEDASSYEYEYADEDYLLSDTEGEHPPKQPDAKPATNISEDFVWRLKDYLKLRNKRFLVKDTLDSRDKTKRDALVNHIIEQLNLFDKARDDKKALIQKELIKKLTEAIDKYPGIHLRTILSQLTLVLMEPTPQEDFSETSKNILKNQEKTAPIYVRKVHELYKNIQSFYNYALKLETDPGHKDLTVRRLAEQLKGDLDYFISQHDQTLPDQDSFNNFKIKFITRLYSQDETIRAEGYHWRTFAFNLLLGIISLGIAIGAKAIHSKLTYGEVRLFAAPKNEGQKQLDELEQQADDLLKPDHPSL